MPRVRRTPYRSLSRRERDVFVLAAKVGCSASEIAGELGISVSTVSGHLTQIYRAFGVKNHQRLIVAYWRHKVRLLRDAAN